MRVRERKYKTYCHKPLLKIEYQITIPNICITANKKLILIKLTMIINSDSLI